MTQRAKWTAAALLAAALAVCSAMPGPAGAGANWRAEFEAVCSKTDSSMSLTVAELEELVARCDGLAQLIGAEDETTRKVYLRRLQRCRDLFVFVLEQKRAEGAATPVPAPVPVPAAAAPAPLPTTPGGAAGGADTPPSPPAPDAGAEPAPAAP